jgi:hypothetical protein
VAKEEFHPKDYKDFLYARAELFCERLKKELPNVEVKIKAYYQPSPQP